MDRYQEKRVAGCLRRSDQLTEGEIKFLTKLKDRKITPFGERDKNSLSWGEALRLNRLAARVGG